MVTNYLVIIKEINIFTIQTNKILEGCIEGFFFCDILKENPYLHS